jgi:hypothetical protein
MKAEFSSETPEDREVLGIDHSDTIKAYHFENS